MRKVILGAVGVGLIAVIFASTRADRSAVDRAQEAPGEPAASAESVRQLGIRAATVDTARRPGEDWSAERARLPIHRDDFEPYREQPALVPVPPVAPLPPSAEAIAESEAILAARPAVQEAVAATLQARRSSVRSNCWTDEMEGSASFPIEVTYSAEGAKLGMSVGDDARAPGVAACVMGQPGLVPASIEAPGVGLTVTVALSLP